MIFMSKMPPDAGLENKSQWRLGEILYPQRKSWIDIAPILGIRPQLKADRGQIIRKHNMKHLFLKMEISNLARKISENPGLEQPTTKNIN